MEGKVKWYNVQKGYGFIAGDDGKDYFMHSSQVPEGIVPKENEAVSFDAKETDKGLQAYSVQLH